MGKAFDLVSKYEIVEVHYPIKWSPLGRAGYNRLWPSIKVDRMILDSHTAHHYKKENCGGYSSHEASHDTVAPATATFIFPMISKYLK